MVVKLSQVNFYLYSPRSYLDECDIGNGINHDNVNEHAHGNYSGNGNIMKPINNYKTKEVDDCLNQWQT